MKAGKAVNAGVKVVTMTDRDQPAGLTAEAASARLIADGPNELPSVGSRSMFRIAFEVLREPMLLLLLAGGIAYLLLGNLTEALVLLGFATFSIAITIIQESRTEHVLEALRDLSSPRALVIRDGARVRIAGREVVRGDVLVLEQGDRIAADAVLTTADDFLTDESLLTGESVPVGKIAGTPASVDANVSAAHRPGGDGQPYVYSGSLVARGSGTAQVLATGPSSEIGRIGQSLATLDTEAPRLRAETTRIVTLCAIGGGSVALLVVALYGFLRGGWIDAVLAGNCYLHVDAARRIPGGPDDLPRDGCVADRQGRRSHAARVGHRDTGISNRVVQRQDRQADRKPHVAG